MPINFTKDLNLLKDDYITKVNNKTGEVILKTYPDYLQRNILASGDSELIKSTWEWIDGKRGIANVAKDKITNSGNSKLIYETYKEFEAGI